MSFEQLTAQPLWLAYPALFVIVMLRANATYWIGRLISRNGRARAQLDRPLLKSAEEFSARWGWAAVPLSFLTIGIQTAVNLSAGLLRMPLPRYLPAVTAGCLIWAGLYATIGLAALEAAVLAAAGSPVGVLTLALIGVITAVLIVRRRRRGAAADPAGNPEPPLRDSVS